MHLEYQAGIAHGFIGGIIIMLIIGSIIIIQGKPRHI
jgi:hypothetical protein